MSFDFSQCCECGQCVLESVQCYVCKRDLCGRCVHKLGFKYDLNGVEYVVCDVCDKDGVLEKDYKILAEFLLEAVNNRKLASHYCWMFSNLVDLRNHLREIEMLPKRVVRPWEVETDNNDEDDEPSSSSPKRAREDSPSLAKAPSPKRVKETPQ